jgi:hypothetical protein
VADEVTLGVEKTSLIKRPSDCGKPLRAGHQGQQL